MIYTIKLNNQIKKVILKFLFFFLLISCSSESENLGEEKMTSDDSNAPQISINSFPATIETISSFQISITDESSVSTRIYIDNDLIATDNSKSISFEIDPFDYSIGTKILQIIATDSNNNEDLIEIPFELKKLLFVLPNPISENGFGQDQFLSVNFNDGSLYLAKKIESDMDGTFYANDDFERQDFVVSLYKTTNTTSINYHHIYSFANIEPGTVLLSSSERYNLFNLGNLPLSVSLLLDLSEIKKPRVNGYNGMLNHSGNGYYLFNYNHEAPKRFFMYSFPDFGNLKSDYSYTLITDLEKTKYVPSNLSIPENFASIQLPNQSEFGLAVEGYETESDYAQNRFSLILSVSNHTISTNTIDIPLFPDLFETYNLLYSCTLDNKSRFSTKQRSLNSPISTNDFKITKNGLDILIDGDHDYSKFIFRYGFNTPNAYANVFDWTFHSRESENVTIPFENFEIPQQVLILFEERMVLPKPSQLDNDSYVLDLEAYNHSETVIYENMMFGSSYNQNEAGDVSWLTYDLKN